MSRRQNPTWNRWTNRLSRFFKRSPNRITRSRSKLRKQIVEQLESRELMALNILSVSPWMGPPTFH